MAMPITPVAVRRSSSTMNSRSRRLGILLVLPALALIAIFYVAPMIMLLGMGFFNFPLLGAIRFSGIDNFVRLVGDPTLLRALGFTVLFTAAIAPLSLVVSYSTAILVRTGRRGTGFFRTSLFLPVAISFTAAAYMSSVMLAPGSGVINQLLLQLGVTDGKTAWFSDPTTAFWVVIVLSIWKTMGTAMVILMAGMQAIPGEIIEAGRIDGARWWQRERLLVMPLLRGPIAVVATLTVAGSLLTFEQFFILTKGGPSNETLTLVFYNYTVSFVRYNLGYGAAISILMTVIILAVVLLQVRLISGRADKS